MAFQNAITQSFKVDLNIKKRTDDAFIPGIND